MTTDRTLGRIGLAMRAGKIVTGEDGVLEAIRTGTACLVVMSADASARTRKVIEDKCRSGAVPLLTGYSRYELGAAVGKPERVLLAVTDRGLADLIRGGWIEPTEVEDIEQTGHEGNQG